MLTIKTGRDLETLRKKHDHNGKSLKTVRAYKYVTRHGYSPIHDKRIRYVIGKRCQVRKVDRNENNDCGAGINLATLPWCIGNMRLGTGQRILRVEFLIKDIVAIPTLTDGKFRVKRCKVVGEYYTNAWQRFKKSVREIWDATIGSIC